MLIIGKIAQFQRQFPQRSQDHRLLADAMRAEGWTADVIQNNVTAYRHYKELMSKGVAEWTTMAETASVTHLKELANDDGTLNYDASMFLKRTGKMPSVKALRGHKGGHYDRKFQPTRRPAVNGSEKQQAHVVAAPSVPHQVEPETDRKIIDVTPVAVDIELPSSVVSDNNAADNGIEMDPQQQAVIALDHGLQALDVDSIYGNDAHLDLIAKHGHKLELLIDLINSRKPRFRR